MIGEHVPYICSHPCTVVNGDHIAVRHDDGSTGVRWLLPGFYNPGDTIPELLRADRMHDAVD
jgi:hypothetical protein